MGVFDHLSVAIMIGLGFLTGVFVAAQRLVF